MGNTKIIRVNIELNDELKRIAELNKIKITDASREVARLLKNNREKKFKLMEEIKF